MEPIKLFMLSYCFCFLALSSFAYAESEYNLNKLLMQQAQTQTQTKRVAREQYKHNTTKPVDSNIFRIKRLHTTKEHLVKEKLNKKLPQVQEQHEADIVPTKKPIRAKKLRNFTKNSHSLNKQLLSKLGFTKVKAPNSHNRKRLAIESRRHASPDDSHMFIVKLPPNMYYYTGPQNSGSIPNMHEGEGVPANSIAHDIKAEESRDANAIKENTNGKKVSFPFNSNGRPGRIYHWNLPIIKKILEDKQRFPNVATATKNRLIDIKDTPTWRKPWENEAYEKTFNDLTLHNAELAESRAVSNSAALSTPNMLMMNSYKKSLKRKSPTYYAPKTAVNKSSFNKYFSGNGKPKGFYVIKENQKKPLYYKNIIS